MGNKSGKLKKKDEAEANGANQEGDNAPGEVTGCQLTE